MCYAFAIVALVQVLMFVHCALANQIELAVFQSSNQKRNNSYVFPRFLWAGCFCLRILARLMQQ